VLNARRRIIYCNAACAEWTGVDAAQLIGLRCDYHSTTEVADGQALAASLCPPPEVFAGRRAGATVGCPGARGKFGWRRAEFLPLGHDTEDCVGIVAFVSTADVHEVDLPEPEGDEPTAAELHQLISAFRQRQRDRHHIDRLIGNSPAAKRVRAQVELALHGRSRVLVVGPRGSGREHVARTIHYAKQDESPAPLVPLSGSLLDAELLRTTITAFVRRCAELETERPGALLLLEADQLSGEAQVELAGLVNVPELDLHMIATARRPLLDLARDGRFRQDLAFALSTLVIELPALADRLQDVPLLAQVFVEEANAAGKRQLSGFTAEALDQLVGYPWPGNVDELADMVQQAHASAEGPSITAANLPRRIGLAAAATAHPASEEKTIVLSDFLAEIETELIRRSLARAKGNKTKAAKLLGMTRARLHRRLVQLRLDNPGDKGV